MVKGKIKGQQGFIAIIALGIFLMLSIFGIIVQRVTIDTIYNIQTTNKYNEASDIANSVMEYLRYEMSMHEAGYNFEVPCAYEEGSGGQTNDPNCDVIAYSLELLDENVEITMEIKGRGEVGEGFSGCFGINGECFVVPLLGNGDAGNRCRLYEPTDNPEAIVDHKGQVSTSSSEGIRQLDYSCNWNKLAFGSSSTDRVTIPFYYDNGGTEPDNITNPFASPTDPATMFYVRIRPPCKPCESRQYPCEPGDDETICDEGDRYRLDDGINYGSGENDIIVQWQLSGECGGEECGLIQYVEYDQYDEIREIESSAITEVKVNGLFSNNLVFLPGIAQGIDINTYDESSLVYINTILEEIEKPILTLFLSEKLISEDESNIPYLEYQILTDKPIGSPKTKASAIINVDGYVFEKTLYKEEQKSLIDFAVQN